MSIQYNAEIALVKQFWKEIKTIRQGNTNILVESVEGLNNPLSVVNMFDGKMKRCTIVFAKQKLLMQYITSKSDAFKNSTYLFKKLLSVLLNMISIHVFCPTTRITLRKCKIFI